MIWNLHSQTKGLKGESQAPEDQETIMIMMILYIIFYSIIKYKVLVELAKLPNELTQ